MEWLEHRRLRHDHLPDGPDDATDTGGTRLRVRHAHMEARSILGIFLPWFIKRFVSPSAVVVHRDVIGCVCAVQRDVDNIFTSFIFWRSPCASILSMRDLFNCLYPQLIATPSGTRFELGGWYPEFEPRTTHSKEHASLASTPRLALTSVVKYQSERRKTQDYGWLARDIWDVVFAARPCPIWLREHRRLKKDTSFPQITAAYSLVC
ncbi:hypothetical protein BDZ89DRAFT_1152662 [Hymenopellis radicata]|nr:hypothetical protein BDZ89DRAFT_1152662 [Hymenopellis radicata]